MSRITHGLPLRTLIRMRVRKSLAPVKRAGAREGGIARAGAGAKWRLLAR